MAKFKFKMENILNLKERVAEQKEQEFAKALQELVAQRALLDSFNQEKKDTLAKLKGELGDRITPLDFRLYTNYIEVIKQKIEHQKKELVKYEQFLEKKRLELVEATKEKKMLDKLKENKFEEHIDEEKKSEQKHIDEIVSYRFKPT